MKPICQRCGHDLVEFGEPDADGMVEMICPASPICPDPKTRKWVGNDANQPPMSPVTP